MAASGNNCAKSKEADQNQFRMFSKFPKHPTRRFFHKWLASIAALGAVMVFAKTIHAEEDFSSLNHQLLQLIAAGKYVEATQIAHRAVTAAELEFGPDNYVFSQALNNLAWLYQFQGMYKEAEPLYTRSQTIKEHLVGPDHPEVTNDRDNLGNLYRIKGRYDEAHIYVHLR